MMEKTLTRDKIKTEKEIAALKKRILEVRYHTAPFHS